MLDDETKYSIEEVIELCKTCDIKIIPREKTLDFINVAGIDSTTIKKELSELKPQNACAGPELDYGENRKGYVYQFKKLVKDKYWCYIKVKVKIANKRVVVVLSFHKEEYDYENRWC